MLFLLKNNTKQNNIIREQLIITTQEISEEYKFHLCIDFDVELEKGTKKKKEIQTRGSISLKNLASFVIETKWGRFTCKEIKLLVKNAFKKIKYTTCSFVVSRNNKILCHFPFHSARLVTFSNEL